MSGLKQTRVALLALGAFLSAGAAQAWGDLGHEVTALIAYRHLTPIAKRNLNALLDADTDTLTPRSFAARATWADKYRTTHRETANWHFIDIEIDAPDMRSACYDFPALPTGVAASQGTAADCVVNKIEQFYTELKDPATPQAERIVALKFLLHFMGDLHQPLHAADHHDRGGNCIGLSPMPDRRDKNLHAYWDVGAVVAMGRNALEIARTLDETVTDAELKFWSEGTPRTWAMESFELGKVEVYDLASLPTCDAPGTVALTAAYETRAADDAATQLAKAGVRIASLLNGALAQ